MTNPHIPTCPHPACAVTEMRHLFRCLSDPPFDTDATCSRRTSLTRAAHATTIGTPGLPYVFNRNFAEQRLHGGVWDEPRCSVRQEADVVSSPLVSGSKGGGGEGAEGAEGRATKSPQTSARQTSRLASTCVVALLAKPVPPPNRRLYRRVISNPATLA